MRVSWQSVPRSLGVSLPILSLLILVAGGVSTAQPMCVYGVSKSLCKGQLQASWTPAACGVNPAGTACNTASAHQAQLNGLLAPGDPSCDQLPELDGATLQGFFEGRLRLQLPDPYRGSLIGKFSIVQGGQSLASGTFDGTLGVGTHRPASCACTSASCEECYAVRFDPSAQVWSIHSEGFLAGDFTAKVRPGCTLRWSYAGNFTAPGTDSGPRLTGPWDFCGTLDGVVECACPQPVKAKRPKS
jgi:hypothetical protein